MDWDWKDLGWDPSGSELSNGGASVDLSLGESSDFSEKAKDLPTKDLKSESLPRGSSKRSRTVNGSGQNVRCSVDGCDSDLSDCREYHRRHRVCEKHSKTPIVCVGGKQQRFCQQCSRFHSLGEFDEVKRSCRKRLDGHNRRRRKPQPPSLFMAAEKFLTSYKGPRILHFGSPQTYNAPFFSMWPATGKSGAEPVMISYDQSSLLSSFANVEHQQDKQLPLFGFNSSKAGHCKEAVSGVPLRQATSGAAAPSVSANGGRKVTSDFEPGSIDSNCALYLLSTLQTQGQELSLVQSTMNCPVQSSPLEDLHFDAGDKYSSSCSESPQEKSTNPLLVVDADTTDLHCDHMIHMRPDEIVENGDLPTFPFFWE